MSGYERRIGRFSGPLAERMVAVVPLRVGERVLDVGCGRGALARPLCDLVGPGNVVAIDSSPGEVAVCAAALPGVGARVGRAEALPLGDDEFDAVFAQLLVHLVEDAPACAREMRRVARPGAPVVTCVWDFAGGMTMLRAFWDACRQTGAPGVEAHDQAGYAYATPAELEALWRDAGLEDVRGGVLEVSAGYSDFADLWEPLAVPDGTPGRYLATLTDDEVEAVRVRLHHNLGEPAEGFALTARAWYVVGRA